MKLEMLNDFEMYPRPTKQAPVAGRAPALSNDQPGFAGRLVAFWKTWIERFALRRKSSGQRLTVVARLDLGGKKSLLIVQCGAQRILVAQGAATITAMMEVSDCRYRSVGKRRTTGSCNPKPFRSVSLREVRRRTKAAALRAGS